MRLRQKSILWRWNIYRKLRLGAWPKGLALAGLHLCLLLGLGAVGLGASAKSPQPSTGPSTGAASEQNPESTPEEAVDTAAERQLEQLARALNDKPTDAAYQRLVKFAAQHAKTSAGARAALALGHYDYTRKRFPEARAWLEKATDPVLGQYALYWQAQTDRAMDAHEAALDKLLRFLRQYPGSAISDSAVKALAQAALAADRPEAGLAALDSYPATRRKSSLLWLRGQARERVAAGRGEKPLAATTDYLVLVYRFPLSDEAKSAAAKIPALKAALGDQFPGTPLTTEIARAETFYEARRWKDVRTTYQALLPKLSGASRERALLRIAHAEARTGGGRQALASVKLTDPPLAAERAYVLSQAHRSANAESEMLAAIEQVAAQYPHSPWTEQALYAAGNFYWVELDRDRASKYYQRVLTLFPSGSLASTAQWRIAWTAYLGRRAEAESRLEEYIRQYTRSSYVVDALYWLGRLNERKGNVAHARSFYLAAAQRFPHTYFGQRAAERLRDIGPDPVNPAEFLSVIPSPPQLEPFDGPVPAAARERWARAKVLRSIAFDNSAEAELRAAHAATRAPQLLLAIAESAVAAGRYAAGIVAVRQLVPQLEARPLDQVPDEVWRAVFPLAYRVSLDREAGRNRLDPMLLAGLIRQESAFASDAISRAGAVGLMQIMPPTGRRVARRLGLSFSRAKLFDPEYNVRLGSSYLSRLLMAYPAREYALAAYNAGESRVKLWTDGQKYDETPEFVESIPFTETRRYVQKVLRNAELYRQLYAREVLAKVPAASQALEPPKP